MSTLTVSLERLGLSENEARIYELCLQQENSPISYISRVLSLNRATTYHYVHELQKRGLISKRTENGRILLSAQREDGLRSYLEYEEVQFKERKTTIEDIVKKLPKVQKQKPTEEDVEYFSGFDGVKLALEKAFRSKNKHWDIIAPKKNFFSEIEESYADYYLSQRKKRHITSRSLWEQTGAERKLSLEITKERNPRYLPKKYSGTFHAVTIIFDTSVLYISSKKEMQAILINSSDIVSSLRMQFNVIWDSSEEI